LLADRLQIVNRAESVVLLRGARFSDVKRGSGRLDFGVLIAFLARALSRPDVVDYEALAHPTTWYAGIIAA
jgi:hypothetical protein